MPDLLRVGTLELIFAFLFTALALLEIANLRRQRWWLRRRIDEARRQSPRLAELAVVNATLERRYARARALIDMMGELNQVMVFQSVLDRLRHHLSKFFAGDEVAIWIRTQTGAFDRLAGAPSELSRPAALDTDRLTHTLDADRLTQALEHGSVLLPPTWQQAQSPWMAAPLLDWRRARIGVVVLTSLRRTAYTAEDAEFFGAVLGHAALAIENAARFELADRLGRIDSLTGLGNRGEFERALDRHTTQARATGQPLSLLLVDVDHFKHINDTRGHPEGDRVLQQIARLIAQDASDPARAFRIGGEEFGLLLTLTKAGAVSAAAALGARIGTEPFFRDGERLTVSIGIASIPEDAGDSGALVAAADRALYQAKAAGRDRVSAA